MMTYSTLPQTCRTCVVRPCEGADDGTMDLCRYGVLFYRDGTNTVKRDATAPIRHIATNLRHEINPILSFIINQVVELNPHVSLKSVDAETPEGRILGAAVILDDTIQMITGVHDFNPLPQLAEHAPFQLHDILLNRFAVYSLLGGANRTTGLEIDIRDQHQVQVTFGRSLLEYMCSVLMDNAWKYAEPDSTLTVRVSRHDHVPLADLHVANHSLRLPPGVDPFAMGVRGHPTSRGFGYGLYWATLLAERYNEAFRDGRPQLTISHRQEEGDGPTVRHVFTIHNIRVVDT